MDINLSQPITDENLIEMGIISDEERHSMGIYSLQEIMNDHELFESNEVDSHSIQSLINGIGGRHRHRHRPQPIYDSGRIPGLIIAMQNYGVNGNIGRTHD